MQRHRDCQALRWLSLAAVSILLFAGCSTSGMGHSSPAPTVHVSMELAPDPPPARNCCRVTLVNPTDQDVYVRCSVMAADPMAPSRSRGYWQGRPPACTHRQVAMPGAQTHPPTPTVAFSVGTPDGSSRLNATPSCGKESRRCETCQQCCTTEPEEECRDSSRTSGRSLSVCRPAARSARLAARRAVRSVASRFCASWIGARLCPQDGQVGSFDRPSRRMPPPGARY
jgi:hypothetical protein